MMKPATAARTLAAFLLALLAGGCGGNLLTSPPAVDEVVTIALSDLAATASQNAATVTWTTAESTTHLVEYGTVSGTYTQATAQSSTAAKEHSVSLSGLAESTMYYYRVTSFDDTLSASLSAENTFTTTAYAGIHVTDLAATASQTTATVTWTTDVPTTHIVEYGTSSGLYELSTVQSQTAATTHSVSLSGLVASATYYYRIRNFHATMPAAVGAEATFTTTATPVIQVTLLAAASASPTSATVTWTTDVPTTHIVEYGTTAGTYAYASALSGAAETTHSVTLSGLSDATTYYYRVRNYSTTLPETVSGENSFLTGSITVTGLAADPGVTTAVVSWTTSPAASAVVDFGTASGSYAFSSYPSGSVTSHSVTLSGLSASTQYYYQVRNYVGSGPAEVSAEGTFTTAATPTIQVTGLTSTNLGATSARITWTTDVAATHLVEYGTSSGSYAYATVLSVTAATSHTVDVTGLSASTTYYYRVRNYSTTFPEAVSGEGSFTTAAVTVTDLAAAPSSTTAVVSWTTSVAATALVDFGSSPGNYVYSTAVSTTASTSHSFTLTGLTPAAQYYYRVRNWVGSVPAATSAESTFTTAAAATIQVTALTAINITATTARISWTTDAPTTHLVEYGTSSGTYAYATVLSGTAAMSHTVDLTGLSASTMYYYRVRNYSTTLPEAVSGQGSFTTAAVTVTDLAAAPSSTTAVVSWTTSVPTTALVDYGTSSGTYAFSTYLSTSASTSHSFTLTGLTPETQYYYRVRNWVGSVPAEPSADGTSFTTLAAPTIQVTSLTATNVTATTARISWTTDTLTTHLVEYGTVSGTYTYATVLSGTAATSHTVDLTGLSANTQYYYRVRNYSTTRPEAVSADGTNFTTAAADSILVSNLAVDSIGTTSVTVNWTTNVATTHLVEYGTSSGSSGSYSYNTIQSETETTSHSVTLTTGLAMMTRYYFRVRNYSAGFTTTVSDESSFDTAPTLEQRLRGIWMVGGLSSYYIGSVVDQVDLYDPDTNAWYTGVTTLNPAVSFAGVASLDGKIYVIGGFDASGATKDVVRIYDVAGNTWSTGAPMTTPVAARANIQAVVAYDQIYVLGGTSGVLATSTYAGTTTTYVFNETDGWSSRTAFSAAALSERLAIPYNDVIYHTGGRSAVATPALTHDGYAAIPYGLTSGLTEAAITTGYQRTGHTGVIYSPASGPAVMVIVGGISALTSGTTGTFIASVATASTATDTMLYLNYPFAAPSTWTVSMQPYEVPMAFASTVLHGSTMYVFGGTKSVRANYADTYGLSYVRSFNLDQITTASWDDTLPDMPVGRWGHTAVTINQ